MSAHVALASLRRNPVISQSRVPFELPLGPPSKENRVNSALSAFSCTTVAPQVVASLSDGTPLKSVHEKGASVRLVQPCSSMCSIST